MDRSAANQPNVIVFFTDQQRWDTTGVHGNPLDLTPNFDAMAQRGTHVAAAFTPQPVCGPARSVMQTGMYATETGCYRNGIALPTDVPTLATSFREAGYATGYIGKWHLAGAEPVPPEQRGGYEYWLASNALEFTSDAYRCETYDDTGTLVRLPGYRVDALTDAAIRFVDERKDRPFFLFLSFLEPHHQNHRDDYPAPEVYRQRYTGRWVPPDLAALGGSAPQHLGGYYGMVRRLDEALGRLLDSLRSLDLLDNTIVVFTSDHGCHFKTRNSEYKRSCHESSIRVPMAIQGPGFDGGGRLRQLVSLIDLPPTLLDAARIDRPPTMRGRSILPLLRGGTDWPEEVFIQISESQVGRAVRTQRWKYGVTAPDADGVRDSGARRYVEQYLYDLEADPYELTNLIGLASHAETSAVLRQRLLRRMGMAGEPPAEIVQAEAKPSGQRRVSVAEAHA
jgi:arylsulfatase A-like enzyme